MPASERRASAPRVEAVAVDDEAPEFALEDAHGQTVRLSSYRGRAAVLLVFYPWAFTGICGGELRDLQADLDEFQDRDVEVLAVSVDSRYCQRVFADREGFTYALLADFWPHGAVARRYGVLHEEAGVALRASFLIDRDGIVRWTVVNGLGEGRSVEDYRTAVERLQPIR